MICSSLDTLAHSLFGLHHLLHVNKYCTKRREEEALSRGDEGVSDIQNLRGKKSEREWGSRRGASLKRRATATEKLKGSWKKTSAAVRRNTKGRKGDGEEQFEAGAERRYLLSS